MHKLYQMKNDPKCTVHDVVLGAIDMLTVRRYRPNLKRIYSNLFKIFNFSFATCEEIVESLLKEKRVIMEIHDGVTSYRNAANYKAGSRKSDRGAGSSKVIEAITTLVSNNPDLEKTGVSLSDIEEYILSLTTNSNVIDNIDKLINLELRNRTVTRLDTGHFILNTASSDSDRVDLSDDADVSGPQSESESESRVGLDDAESGEFDNDDDYEDEVVKEKLPDRDYKPNTKVTAASEAVKKSGRISKRSKNSRYDPSVYVFPSLKKKSKPPTREAKPKKGTNKKESVSNSSKKNTSYAVPNTKCFICKALCVKSSYEQVVKCVKCPQISHPLCVEKEQILELNIPFDRKNWQCMTCRAKLDAPRASDAFCFICSTSSSNKFLGSLVKCSICKDFYHRKCHKPIIEKSMVNPSWKCFYCIAKEENKVEEVADQKDEKNDEPTANLESTDIPSTAVTDTDLGVSASQTEIVTAPDKPAQTEKSDGVHVLNPDVPDSSRWTTGQVYDYFSKHFDKDVAGAFADQDIDGYALKLMKRSDVLYGMGFNLGLGLRVLYHIKRLQLCTNDRRLIWASTT